MTKAERSPRRLPHVHERPWAVGAYLACAALVGVAWAAPLAGVMGAVTGAYPRGDAEIFDPGGLLLLEALQRTQPAAPALSAAWVITAIVALLLGLVALGFALAQLGAPGRSRPAWALVRAVRALPTLALVGVVALIAEAVVVAVLMFAGSAITRAAWPIPPSRDVARFALWGLVLLALITVSAIHDLARAAAVTGPSRTYASLRAAVLVVWRSPLRVAGSFAWRFVAGLAAIGLAVAAGVAIGERAPAAIVASALVHQIGLAAAGWCRLSWLARAAHHVRPIVHLTAKRSKPAPATETKVAPTEEPLALTEEQLALTEASPAMTEASPAMTEAPPAATEASPVVAEGAEAAEHGAEAAEHGAEAAEHGAEAAEHGAAPVEHAAEAIQRPTEAVQVPSDPAQHPPEPVEQGAAPALVAENADETASEPREEPVSTPSR
ncbi:MAG: hypothetical protein U0441_00485 [Polyangiaceae bacterium]